MTSQMGSRDSSSDSDISEWTVVDENLSLEWNDDAKYHFRRSKANTVNPSPDGSDDDSIEVVSDVDVIEEAEEVDPEDEDKTLTLARGDGNSSEDLGSPSNMVWYRLHDAKTIHKDSKSLQDPASAENITAVNPRDNWDLIVILVVALIGGIALGYFWGLRHEHVATSKTLNSKLQFDNILLRHKLRCMYLTLKYRLPKPSSQGSPAVSPKDVISLKQQPLIATRYEKRYETNKLPLEQQNNERLAQDIFSKEEKTTSQNQVELDVIKASPDPSNEDADVSNMTDLDDVDLAIVEDEVDFELEDLNDNFSKGEIEAPLLNPPLKQSVAKAFSFLSSGGKFWIDTNHSLSVSLDLMENIGLNLLAIDSIQLEKVPPKLYAKFSSMKLKTHKSSNKLVDKVDKYVHKLSKKIFIKLQKFKSTTMKNFCNLKEMVEAERGGDFVWPEQMVRECDISIQKKNVEHFKYLKSKRMKKEAHPEHWKTPEKQVKNRASKTEINKKSTKTPKVKSNQVARDNNTDEPRDDKSDITTGKKVKDGSESNGDDLFLVDYTTSNVSGEWVIEMAKGRAEKRENDHQSDWLFERAQARKCHRDDEQNEPRPSVVDGNIHYGKRSQKKFKKIKEMIRNALPSTTTFTDAAKSVKEAFKALRNKVRNPSRQ